NFASGIMHNQTQIGINQNGIIMPIQERPYYGRFSGMVSIHDDVTNNLQFPRPDFVSPVYQVQSNTGAITSYPNQEQNIQQPMQNLFVPVQLEAPRNMSPYTFDDPNPSDLLPDYRVKASGFASGPMDLRIDTWPTTNNVS
ncbi:jg22384, partial [Pararge aegeria aegeria]